MGASARLETFVHGPPAGLIDLGDDPPLSIGDDELADRAPIRRAVSWRWLTGTILTGVTSIGLMGAALVAALNSPNQFASLPEAFAATSAEVGRVVFGRKGDRMRPIEEQVSSRQILQVSTVTRQGERDFIKLRPFAKINATLSTGSEELAAEVPEFDVLRIFADSSTPDPVEPAADPNADADPDSAVAATDDVYVANVDGEVAVKVSLFPIDGPDLDASQALDTAEIEQIVRAAAGLAVDDTATAALPFADPTGLATDDSPFSALGVRIVPENVSNIAKSDAISTGAEGVHEQIIPVAADGDLRSLLLAHRIAGADADQIVDALSQLVDVNHLHAGQKIRLAFAGEATEAVSDTPVRVSVYQDGAHQATVARADSDAFVRGDEPTSPPSLLAEAGPEAPPSIGGLPRIYDAVYQTALAQQIPTPLIDQLIRVFAFDVDFQARITPGDSLEVFHSLPDSDDRDAGEPEILFAALTLNGIAKRFYRFRSVDDGLVDYYDEEGKSAKKFLLRKPMTAGVLRSGFGMRRHPILGYKRLHSGVDYAAPRGTPILAAANGVVEKAGRSSGYGNLTVIAHTNGYETAYGHQSSFAKGIVPGARVRQGQVIGYVGSTGLSTGPHLHFEIRINQKAVDPLRIRLPRGRVLEGELLTAFEHERERIDGLLGIESAPTKVASVN
ncbi:MAG: peptidoglycan DD-metalloendopeptidase family protein [Bauldia sp.]